MAETILDLCGGTGSWSRPYKEAGYNVILIDTLTEGTNVRLLRVLTKGYIYYNQQYYKIKGILAAPPCTDFSISGSQWWEVKGTEQLLESLSIVDACLRIITSVQPEWWALENPIGRLATYLGEPKYKFHPYEYGDDWTKQTCIWGEHNIPEKTHDSSILSSVIKVREFLHWISPNPSHLDIQRCIDRGLLQPDFKRELISRALLRSITPPGFAKAFFKANP